MKRMALRLSQRYSGAFCTNQILTLAINGKPTIFQGIKKENHSLFLLTAVAYRVLHRHDANVNKQMRLRTMHQRMMLANDLYIFYTARNPI